MISRLAVNGLMAAILMGFAATPLRADLLCSVPDTVVLDVIPAGCQAVLGNGPITYTGVVAANGDIHNIELDSVILLGLNNSSNSVEVSLQGVDTDVTTSQVAGFTSVTTNAFFQTSPGNNNFAAGSGTQTFTLIHLIDGFGAGTFKLNVGDNNGGHAAENSTIASYATDSGGVYSVTSMFDIFTELSLNGGARYTVANDDFNGVSVGPGAAFSLQNTPEPRSASLFVAGIAALLFARRRKGAIA